MTLYDLCGAALTRLMRHDFTISEAALFMSWKSTCAAETLDIYPGQEPGITDAMIFTLQPPAETAISAAGATEG